jgi:hypothetical protein
MGFQTLKRGEDPLNKVFVKKILEKFLGKIGHYENNMYLLLKMTMEKVCNCCGVSKPLNMYRMYTSSIGNILYKNKCKQCVNPPKKKVIDENEVIEKYKELNNIKSVATLFKKTPSTISGILQKNGIIIPKTRVKPIFRINLETNEKTCSKCLITKPLEDFWLMPNGKYPARCRRCQSEHTIQYNKERYKNDPEFRKKRSIQINEYREKNPDKVKKWSSDWAKNNRDKVNEIAKEYRKKNPEYFKNKAKRIHRKRWDNDPEHRERVNKQSKERFQNLYYNDEEFRQNTIKKAQENHKKRYKTDELYKFITDIRKVVGGVFRRMGYTKRSQSMDLLGAEWIVVKEHLENLFQDGMTWDNYGVNGWHVDHIIPISSANNEDEVIKLCHYKNLQPLWAKDNLRKGNKIGYVI